MKLGGIFGTGFRVSLIDKMLLLPGLGCLTLIALGSSICLAAHGMSALLDALSGLIGFLE